MRRLRACPLPIGRRSIWIAEREAREAITSTEARKIVIARNVRTRHRETAVEARRLFQNSFDGAMPIALKALYAGEDQNALMRATIEARETISVKTDEGVPAEKLTAFNLEVDQRMAPYFETARRLRPKP
jgi:hypothetical protein